MEVSVDARFFYRKIFYKKMSLKNPKTFRKCQENVRPQIPELEFLKTLIFTRVLKVTQLIKFYFFFI